MDENPRFRLVFRKLHEALADDAGVSKATPGVRILLEPELSREELDEIDALRRIVLEVTEPEPTSFTTT